MAARSFDPLTEVFREYPASLARQLVVSPTQGSSRTR
jgi:hypothetical protein